MPKLGRDTRPPAINWSAIPFARSIGIANPRPMLPPAPDTDAPAVLMPTRRARQSTRAPPLLPGLIDASVWIAPTRCAEPPFSDGTRTYRLSALTIPDVTELVRPSGDPS